MAHIGFEEGREFQRAFGCSGLPSLNDVQKRAVPAILAGKNLLIVAPTGCGKTEAAMLPILSRYLQSRGKGISILYITPLRALGRDMVRRLSAWAQALGISVDVRHGDTSPATRRKQARYPPELMVTTPETLQALLAGTAMRKHLAGVRWVVVDEVHAILTSKRGVQLAVGLERLRLLCREGFQIIGLSATLAEPEEAARLICGLQPREIQVPPLAKEYQFRVEYPQPHPGDLDLADDLFSSPEAAARVRRIKELVEAHRSVLVFANARTLVEMLGYRLSKIMQAGVHHGSISREERSAMEDSFKRGELRALVCTSTLELGIDVGFVDFVVQYLSPMAVSSLVQRFGRSGHRPGERSQGSIICTTAEQVLESIAIARLFIDGRLESPRPHEKALDVLAHQVAGLLMDGLNPRPNEAYELIRRAHPYRKLTYSEFLDVVHFMESLGILSESAGHLRRTSATSRYYFENLSMIPDERRYPIMDLSSGSVVGNLGEEFVALYCRVGLDFICRGRVWRIVKLGNDGVVTVSPSEYNLGAIPGWDGELPPVAREVAQRTALLRRRMDLLEPSVAVDDEAMALVEEELEIEKADGLVPDPGELAFEIFDRFLVVHCCYGTNINRTLILVLRQLFAEGAMGEREGPDLVANSDAYRIMIDFGRKPLLARMERVARRLADLRAEDVEALVRRQIEQSYPFSLKHIAARFGVIPRGIHLFDARSRDLENRLRGTPAYEEGIREGMVERLDVQGTAELVSALSQGEVVIRCFERSVEEGPTICARRILERYAAMPELGSGTSREETRRIRNRLLRRTVRVRCFDCGEERRTRIGDLEERPECLSCGSRFLTLPSGVEERLALEIKVSGGRAQNREMMSKLKRKADLVAIYGRKAILALEVRGIGPQTASKILSRMHEDEAEFIADLVRASGKYEVTRPYWPS